jgi:hypothetical protein
VLPVRQPIILTPATLTLRMAQLKFYGMKIGFDEIMAAVVKR